MEFLQSSFWATNRLATTQNQSSSQRRSKSCYTLSQLSRHNYEGTQTQEEVVVMATDRRPVLHPAWKKILLK